MAVKDDDSAGRSGLGAPEHERSGRTIDEAVDKAEAGSHVDGEHTPSGQAASGESRVERMVDVEPKGASPAAEDEARQDGPRTPSSPSPADIGSGGAQRIEGARISDRVAGGEAVPDGPPFESDYGPGGHDQD